MTTTPSASPRDRVRRRRQLMRWTAPLVVLGALGGVKLLAMSGAAQIAADAFVVGNLDVAARAADTLGFVNVVRPFTASFDAGTVAAARAQTPADLDEAAALLRTALAAAPPDAQCVVRLNLAVVLEASGDAAQDEPARAARLYRDAQQVAAAAPPGCAELPSVAEARGDAEDESTQGQDQGEPERTAADDLGDAAARADQKAQGAEQDQAAEGQGDEGEAESPDPAPLADAEREAEFEERQVEAQAKQQEARAKGGGAGAAGAGGATVSRPW